MIQHKVQKPAAGIVGSRASAEGHRLINAKSFFIAAYRCVESPAGSKTLHSYLIDLSVVLTRLPLKNAP